MALQQSSTKCSKPLTQHKDLGLGSLVVYHYLLSIPIMSTTVATVSSPSLHPLHGQHGEDVVQSGTVSGEPSLAHGRHDSRIRDSLVSRTQVSPLHLPSPSTTNALACSCR